MHFLFITFFAPRKCKRGQYENKISVPALQLLVTDQYNPIIKEGLEDIVKSDVPMKLRE